MKDCILWPLGLKMNIAEEIIGTGIKMFKCFKDKKRRQSRTVWKEERKKEQREHSDGLKKFWEDKKVKEGEDNEVILYGT